MSAHVLLNLLNKWRNTDKMLDYAEHFITRSPSLVNSISQEHVC